MPDARPRAARRCAPLLLPLLAAAAAVAPAPGGGRQDTAPFPRQGRYLGAEQCIDCHDVEADGIAENPHRDLPRSAAAMGCETCHGPGHEHGTTEENPARLITYPPALPVASQRALCGRCHAPEAAGHGGDLAGFEAAGLGCTECHDVHGAHEVAMAGVRVHGKAAADALAEPVGAAKCVECHPVRDRLLQASAHGELAAAHDAAGCETCHGEGSAHAEHRVGRLISRPDRARDGVQTCRACHEDVDEAAFHWRDEPAPLLSPGLTCTTCHRVHREREAGAGNAPDADTGEPTAAPTNALCARCHEPAFAVLEGTIHRELGGRDTPLALGCGACHDGAAAHAAGAGRADLIDSLHGSSAGHQRAVCNGCHEGEPALRHHASGAHQRNDVGCLACHSPAAPAGGARDDAERGCAACHPAVAAEFRQPNHHPVGTSMHCSDCHEPHGARARLRDRELRTGRCVECHRDLRGPFVFAHQASRLDGCIACHAPHGASNRRLLRQHTTQQSCLQCHGDFPAFHDQTPGAVFTNCVSCHTEVHGSNHSRFLFR